MAITLPTSPAPASLSMGLVSNAIDLKPTMGGPTQRIARLGSRWQVQVSLPPMSYGSAMAWIAALTQGPTSLMRLSLGGLDQGSTNAGSIVVNGAGQAGTSLAVSGGTASYSYRAGQFISLFDASADRYYLHQLREAYTLNGSGAGVLPIYPALRSAPVTASAITQNPPIIEGWLNGDGFSVDAARITGLTFSIMEAE